MPHAHSVVFNPPASPLHPPLSVCFHRGEIHTHEIHHFKVSNSVAFTAWGRHHLDLVPNHSYHSKVKPCNHHEVTGLPAPPRPKQPQICLLSLWIDLFWRLPICGLVQSVTFCVWFLPLGMFLRFIHAVAPVSSQFLLKAECYSSVCMYHILFIHSSVHSFIQF